MRPLDPTAWRKLYGNYAQRNAMLRRVRDVRGHIRWDIEIDHVKIGSAKRLSAARKLALKLTARPDGATPRGGLEV